MSNKNLVNGKAIKFVYNPCCSWSPTPANSFLHEASVSSKMGRKNPPCHCSQTKPALLNHSLCFADYFPLMPGTGLNLQTSFDGFHERDIHDANYN